MLLGVLASCANTLSGTYVDSTGIVKLTFDGDKVTYSSGVGALSLTLEGTYKIDGDEITLTIDGSPINGTLPYDKDGKTITIGGVTYTKK
jgi:hypothetical protein